VNANSNSLAVDTAVASNTTTEAEPTEFTPEDPALDDSSLTKSPGSGASTPDSEPTTPASLGQGLAHAIRAAQARRTGDSNASIDTPSRSTSEAWLERSDAAESAEASPSTESTKPGEAAAVGEEAKKAAGRRESSAARQAALRAGVSPKSSSPKKLALQPRRRRFSEPLPAPAQRRSSSGSVPNSPTQRRHSAIVTTASRPRPSSAGRIGNNDTRRTSFDTAFSVTRSRDLRAAMEYMDDDAMEALPPPQRYTIKQIFVLYLGPGGNSMGAGLTISRFRRILRDCGVLTVEEGEGASPKQRQPSQTRSRWRRLTLSQADLMLQRATSATMDGQLAMRLMTPGALALAFSYVASHCLRKQVDAEEDNEPMRMFCRELLDPLCEKMLLLAGEEWDLAAIDAIAAQPDVAALIKRNQSRVSVTFLRYAYKVGAPEPYRKGHWTASSMSRFSADYHLGYKLSHSMMHKLFDDCTEREFEAGRGEEDMLSFQAFQLCLVAMAEKLFQGLKPAAEERLRTLFLRMNALGAEDLAAFNTQPRSHSRSG